MIDYITGKIIQNKSTEVVLETNGIGYSVKVSLATAKQLPDRGAVTTLKTYLHVRENAVQLFGFADEQERELFLGLLSISGVGPKLALTLLSGLSVEQIQDAIYRQDEKTLSSISGVGKKTAQRLIVELKDKIAQPKLSEAARLGIPVGQEFGYVEKEAILALVSLGYSRGQSARAVLKVQKKESCKRSDELIKKALQII
ncbi:MAG: Holliday junction branch migration protein RuvA [Calditrichaeota bacterium]|nr:Holliday junction branch migration protein RuvA [Calditrichota bacterium]